MYLNVIENKRVAPWLRWQLRTQAFLSSRVGRLAEAKRPGYEVEGVAFSTTRCQRGALIEGRRLFKREAINRRFTVTASLL